MQQQINRSAVGETRGEDESYRGSGQLTSDSMTFHDNILHGPSYDLALSPEPSPCCRKATMRMADVCALLAPCSRQALVPIGTLGLLICCLRASVGKVLILTSSSAPTRASILFLFLLLLLGPSSLLLEMSICYAASHSSISCLRAINSSF